MTKSVKHKRLRKSQLQKLKLKSGKKLKPAQNETKTDFKVRKIILKQQLAEKDQDALVTKKKLNLKDLISRLTHHSVYVKQDGLDGIKEIINGNSKEALTPDIAKIVQSIVPCFLDIDKMIRNTAIKIIDKLLTKIGTLMNPYVGILSAHLSCAMVHLNPGVQTDSVQLMETLMKHVPSSIAKNANTILENYLYLIARKISKKSSISLGSERVSKLERSCYLISNPHSNQATTQWRIQLLKSMSSYLGAILLDEEKVKTTEPVSIRETIVTGCLPPLLNNSTSDGAESNLKILTDVDKVKAFVSSLSSILFEVWAEVDTGSEYSIQGNPLNSLAIMALLCITQIILHMWKLVRITLSKDPIECTWFMQCIRKPFNSTLIRGFPYSAHKFFNDSEEDETEKASKKRNKRRKVAQCNRVEEDCQRININLASIVMMLSKNNSEMRKRVVDYYTELLQIEKDSPYIPDIVDTCCLLLPSCDLSLGSKILSASSEAFLQGDKFRKSLIKIPLKATEWDCRHLTGSDEVKTWIELLLRERGEVVLFALLQFKLRNVPGYQKILSENKNLLNDIHSD